jgi:formate--tetrahydrofolate ligase
MLSDIEIAQHATVRPIVELARDLQIPEDQLEPYGRYKAKLSLAHIASLAERPDGKLILISGISPTPAGEGKSTTTVGLGDALNRIGQRAIVCLREPSIGPVFGMKVAPPAAATRRSCRWRTSTCTSPATSTRSHLPITCSPR